MDCNEEWDSTDGVFSENQMVDLTMKNRDFIITNRQIGIKYQ